MTMAANAKLREAIKWHGGKRYVAEMVVSLMPRHLNYVEPFFGGGKVLFARDPADERLWLPGYKGVSEVVNDINGDLMNFWRVLRGPDSFEAFRRAVEATPFAGPAYEEACDLLGGPGGNEVERAWAFFVACRQSHSGRMDAFTGITKRRLRRGMNNEVSAWLSSIEGLPAIHARLVRVLILSPQPALDVIAKFDGPETLFYLDPPYMPSTRTSPDVYPDEMSAADHEALLDVVTRARGKFIISGYACPLYDDALDAWERVDKPTSNHSGTGRVKQQRVEVLWVKRA
jgi:DNA adenine methylase